MKKRINSLIILAALLAITGCNKKEQEAQSPAGKSGGASSSSVEAISTAPPFTGGPRTSFHEVTSQLDPGGSVFMYLATDQWLAGLSTNIARFQGMMLSLPGPSQDERDQIERGFSLATRLVQRSGVEDVTGVGLSGAPVAPGLFRNKFILHHPAGAGQGFLWSMFGRAPHALDAQSMLPANTAFAAFGDVDITRLWQVLERELAQSGILEVEEAARAWPQNFEKATKLSWPGLLESLGGEAGMLLSLDETKVVEIPMGNGRMAIPAPSLLLAVKINNNLLYDRLAGELQSKAKVVPTNEGGLKMCSMSVPLPLPVPLELVVASSGDYLYLASSRDLVRNVQAVREGRQPGLKASSEFQELARHLPAQGNQFVYVSRRLGETIADLQGQALDESPMPPDQRDMLRQFMGGGKSSYSLAIGAHTATGWQTVSVGNQDSSSALVLAPTVGVTAVAAGMLLPALAKAKAKAQTISSVNNLKQLGLATRMYSNDNQEKFPNAATWSDDLKPFLGSTKVYKAPGDPGPGPCSYAYNVKLSGLSGTKINPQTVLFFEVEDGKWNQSGGPEMMLRRPRGGTVFAVGFADGSVQQIAPARVGSLRWDP